MNHNTSDTTAAENSGNFDPRQAAALLDQTTVQARRRFTSGTPLLWVYRAAFVLVAFGGYWLSVRGRQDPNSAPPGGLVALIFLLVAINIGWSTWELKRAGAGVRGPAQRKRQAWIGVMLLVWIVAYGITAPLYHATASHPVWGLYPANAPLMIVGLIGAASAAALKDWITAGPILAIAIIAAVAGFGGPAGVWLILGIGLCAVCLGTAAFKFCQQRRGVVRP
jgi:hypothetical protein